MHGHSTARHLGAAIALLAAGSHTARSAQSCCHAPRHD